MRGDQESAREARVPLAEASRRSLREFSAGWPTSNSRARPEWRRRVPPTASTSSRPTIWSPGQSPPFTRTSGSRRAMTSRGVRSSKITTASTDSKAARISARSRSGITGRPSPFNWRTLASLFSPTINASPNSRASSRLRIWPGCSKSKQTVCEDDAAAVAFLAAKPHNRLLKSQDCRIQGVSMRPEKQQSELREKLVYHAREVQRARAGSGIVGQSAIT